MSVKKKPRGIALLAAIFDEIAVNIPQGEVSNEELLGAAQKLIKLSKKEYVNDKHSYARYQPGYYSHDVCNAFEKFPWRILEAELAVQNDFLTNHDWRNRLECLPCNSQTKMILQEING